MPDVSMSGISFKIEVSADNASQRLDKLTGKLKKTASAMASVQSPSETASGELDKTGREAERTAKKISRLEAQTKKLRAQKLSAAFKQVGSSAKFAAKSLGTTLIAPLKRMGESIKSSVSSFTKLGAAFKRILFYRAIRSIIREIGDAFRYGVNNLYAWSSGVGGQFAASMNQISTAFAYFKNSVGAAVAPLINALAPAIDFVIDKAVTLLNVINQLFARLSGATYWTRATKQAQAYGGAVGGAGGAAKEALRYLAPFDELNVLPSQSGGGGGGGGGGAGGGLFEDVVEFSEGINDLFDLINSNKFFEAGELLAEKVGNIVDSLNDTITSDGFRNKILGTLSNITDIINGFFYGITFSDGASESIATRLGGFIGNAISLGLEAAHTWLTKINWDSIGTAIAQAINGLVDRMRNNPVNFGQVFADWINAGISFLGGIVSTLNWKDIGLWIAENINSAIENINWEGLTTTISTALSGLKDMIVTAAKNIKWGELISQIWAVMRDSGLWKVFAAMFTLKLLTNITTTLGAALPTVIANLIASSLAGAGGSSAASGAAGAGAAGATGAAGAAAVPVLAMALAGALGYQAAQEGRVYEVMGVPDISSEIEGMIPFWENFGENLESLGEKLGFERVSGIPDPDKDATPVDLVPNWEHTHSSGTWDVTANITDVQYGSEQIRDKLSKTDVTARLTDAEVGAELKKGGKNHDKRYLDETARLFDAEVGKELKKGGANHDKRYLDETARLFDAEVGKELKKGGINHNKRYLDTTANFSSAQDGLTKGQKTFYGSTAYVEKAEDHIPWINKIFYNFRVAVSSVTGTKAASGGVYSGGAWHPIQAYASGGYVGGQLFLAREAGPELVGTLKGHTAVMNNDQIVASVSAGVARAIAGIQFHMTGFSSVPIYEEDEDTEEAMYRATVRALSELGITGSIEAHISEGEVYQSVRRANTANTRRTGVNALA